jgi:flagellar FliL protein
MSTDTATAPTKRRRPKTLLVVLLILLAGGGAGAYWALAVRPASTGQQPPSKPATKAGVVPLDPFVVNLADIGGASFLRVTLALVVADEALAAEVHEDAVLTMQIRSAILEHLAQQTGTVLVTPAGKAGLKTALIGRMSDVAHGTQVTDVLFSEFVVQF